MRELFAPSRALLSPRKRDLTRGVTPRMRRKEVEEGGSFHIELAANAKLNLRILSSRVSPPPCEYTDIDSSWGGLREERCRDEGGLSRGNLSFGGCILSILTRIRRVLAPVHSVRTIIQLKIILRAPHYGRNFSLRPQRATAQPKLCNVYNMHVRKSRRANAPSLRGPDERETSSRASLRVKAAF